MGELGKVGESSCYGNEIQRKGRSCYGTKNHKKNSGQNLWAEWAEWAGVVVMGMKIQRNAEKLLWENFGKNSGQN